MHWLTALLFDAATTLYSLSVVGKRSWMSDWYKVGRTLCHTDSSWTHCHNWWWDCLVHKIWRLCIQKTFMLTHRNQYLVWQGDRSPYLSNSWQSLKFWCIQMLLTLPIEWRNPAYVRRRDEQVVKVACWVRSIQNAELVFGATTYSRQYMSVPLTVSYANNHLVVWAVKLSEL
jgi:hypothetical protein